MSFLRFLHPERRQSDLDDEIAAHLALAAADKREQGADAESAQHEARREFGNIWSRTSPAKHGDGSGSNASCRTPATPCARCANPPASPPPSSEPSPSASPPRRRCSPSSIKYCCSRCPCLILHRLSLLPREPLLPTMAGAPLISTSPP